MYEEAVTELREREGALIGDVCNSWLGYVPWLVKDFPGVQFVVLRRDKTAVAASFQRKVPRTYFLAPFPWWADPQDAESVELYWTIYCHKVGQYMQQYPDRFLLIETEQLSTPDAQRRIQSFLHLPERPVTMPWINRTDHPLKPHQRNRGGSET